MQVKFSPPDIGEKEIEYVSEVLRSGWITTGPKTKEFEKKLAEYIGTKKVVCLNSQTACAETVLRILGIGQGDEVIVPAYTYTASASVVLHVGAKPVLIDSQEDSLEMDYEKVKAAITPKTKAIIPVSLGGVPCDYDKIKEIIEEKKELFSPKEGDSLAARLQQKIGRVIIVEDAAHALGATYKGEKVGHQSDFTTYSFHAVKNLTTAEGGAFTWKVEGFDEEIYKEAMLLSLHGQSKDALSKDQPGAWEYDIVGTYYKCNMTDIMAAIGLAQLERYDEMQNRRHEIINKYDKALKPLGVKSLPHVSKNAKSSGHLYIANLPETTKDPVQRRNQVIIDMANKGVSCNVHYKPLPMHTAYKELGYDIKDFPNAYNHYKNEITLPLHTLLTDEEVEYTIEKLSEIIR